MALKNRLQQEIKKREWSKYRFWKETGLARFTAYRLIDDPFHKPDGEVIDRVCKTLNLRLDQWLEYVPDEQAEQEQQAA